MKTEPQKAHQWLYKLVNEWTYDVDAPMEPGKPAREVYGHRERGFSGRPLDRGTRRDARWRHRCDDDDARLRPAEESARWTPGSGQ